VYVSHTSYYNIDEGKPLVCWFQNSFILAIIKTNNYYKQLAINPMTKVSGVLAKVLKEE